MVKRRVNNSFMEKKKSLATLTPRLVLTVKYKEWQKRRVYQTFEPPSQLHFLKKSKYVHDSFFCVHAGAAKRGRERERESSSLSQHLC
jgi:hypothetical protein